MIQISNKIVVNKGYMIDKSVEEIINLKENNDIHDNHIGVRR